MDRVINIKIVGNYISKDNKNAGVKGEANVTKLRISFDADWNKYSKKITFWNAKGLNPVVISLTTNLLADVVGDTSVYLVPIPTEPLSEAGLMTFVIDGFLNDKRQRSMSDTLVVSDAPIDDRATQPVELTPSQIDQFQAQLETILNDIHDAVEAKEDIQNMSVSSVALATGEKAFVEKAERDGVVNLHFGLPTGDKGDKGDKGTSAVHIGKEAPTDPDVTVWVYTYTDEEANEYGSFVNKSILKIKNRNGEWVNVATNVVNDAIKKCEDAAKSATEAANTLNLSAEEIRSGGFVEALKELNDGRKFTIWVGTHEDYKEDLANGVDFTDTFCVFEDDTSWEDLTALLETLQANKAPRELVEETIDGKNFDAELDRIYKAMPENSMRNVLLNTYESGMTIDFGGGQVTLTICKFNDSWGSIRGIRYSPYAETAPLEFTKSLSNGVWTDWCWVNPPCLIGVEYKTTEMWNGSSVYTMVVDCGTVPSNATKSFPHEIENLSSVLRIAGHTDRGAALPFYQDKDIFIQIGVGSNIVIISTGFFDGLKAYVQLWYTKTTNN